MQPSPFQPQTNTFVFSTSTSAGTAVQITPFSATSGPNQYQQYQVANAGANGAWVTIAPNQAAAVQTIPAIGSPGNATWVEAGNTRVFSGPPQAWFNAQGASAGTLLYITGGEGFISGVTSPGGGSSGPTSNVAVISSVLPTGASTAALQSNVQSAPGTPQTVALTVQGNASGVPILVANPISIPVPPTPFPATIAAGATYNTGIIAAGGYKSFAAACTLSQTGVLTIQRYIDVAGTIALGSPITQALTANTPGTAWVSDGQPTASWQVSIQNTSGSLGTLSATALLMSA